MVIHGGASGVYQECPTPAHSEEDSSGSWPHQLHHTGRIANNMNTRSGISRQVALNTLSAMHRRYNLPGVVQSGARPSAEYRASANKSLDMLRQTIQNSVTKEIDQVIKKYLEKFFVPAVNNIRSNLGEESVGEDQVRAVCRAMLDGARSLYVSQPRAPAPRRATSPSELSDSESSNGADSRFGRPSSSPKRKESDTDSDLGVRRKRRIEGSACPSHKWDPARINQNTLFIMGSVANKVLGLGQSRGRLYSKHSSLVRYPADSADKEWIANQNMTTPSGGKTYVMVLEDIEELVVSEGYRNSPSLRLDELSGFRAPPFMLRKIQAYFSRHSDMSEEYTSSTPTPTPPPIDITKSDAKTENREQDNVVIKLEPSEEQYGKEGVLVKLESRSDGPSNQQYSMLSSNDTIKLEKVEDGPFKYETGHHIASNPPGTYTSIVSSGVSSMDGSSYWKCIGGNQQVNDSSVRVDLNTASEFIDADIEFLSSDFCSYVDSEADVKKSFDKITDGGGGELYIPGDGAVMSAGSVPGSGVEHINSYNKNTDDPNTPRPAVVTSFVRNIDVSGMPSSNIVHTYVTATGTAPPVSVVKTSGVPTSQQMSSPPMFSVPSCVNQATFSQGLNTYPQTQMPTTNANIITIQSNNVVQQTTRTVYSLANTPKVMNASLPSGPTIIGFGARPTVPGSIGNFINISTKNFSSGNILHNAIVSRNMINRGMSIARAELGRTNIVTSANVKSTTIPANPTGTIYSRMAVPVSAKMDDDSSITTTKSMIDNTCNSSAMLKKVLTLGSAGVNKTFLTPPTQKGNPSSRAHMSSTNASPSSNLSASHATLSALLSSGSDSVMGQDKKISFPSTSSTATVDK